jgi:hypothetical protein
MIPKTPNTSSETYLQSLRHSKVKLFGLDQEIATTCPLHWSPELILGAFCTIFGGGPVGTGVGAKVGREMTEQKQNLNHKISP